MDEQERNALDQWQQGGKWFCYRDHSIFCRVEGKGVPLLLIHGFPTASWDWHRLWPSLIQRYQVITLDMMGFGFSDKPRDYPYSILDQADLIVAFIRELKLQRCHLLCHDYGDSVGQELLARQLDHVLPFAIDSACFLNGALFPETHRPVLMQKLLISPFGGLVSRLLSQRIFDSNMRLLFSPHYQPDETTLSHLWALIQYNNGLGVVHNLIHYMEERRCHRHRWVDALQTSKVPLRFINGVADPVSGEEMADRYEALVRRPDVIRLDGVGHYPHLEVPEITLEAYLSFRASFKPVRECAMMPLRE
ncbi:MAG: alpha/beta hydrolase [Hahellaceae bacterium]|nr:alpha/beta hydrolase [Hahellaceae bacterium]MCP5169379.1 alpha/beta hydrolase [Hahellaceae bacterium]